MSRAGCQNNPIDVNFHIQKVWKVLIKNSADKIRSKNDKEIKVSPLMPITVKPLYFARVLVDQILTLALLSNLWHLLKIMLSLMLQSLLKLCGEILWKFWWESRDIPHLFPWNALISKIQFLKKIAEPLLWSMRLLWSNYLETQSNENSKWKLVKTRCNPIFGVSDLENDFLTSTTSEWAQWFFSKITFLKSGDQAEKNEL